MNRLRLLIFLFFFIGNYSFCNADENTIFRNITIEDGLYHSNIGSIVQDRFGYMWIATNEGLQRYDGKHFRHYGMSDSESSLPSSKITSMCMCNKRDLLIVGYHYGHFSIIDVKTDIIKNFNLQKHKLGDANIIVNIKHLKDNLFLLVTLIPNSFYILNINDNSITELNYEIEGIKDKLFKTNDIIIDAGNSIWLATNLGLFKSNIPENIEINCHFNFVRISDVVNVNSIVTLDDNYYSVVSENDIYKLNRKNFNIENITPHALSNVKLKKHTADNKGNLWISTIHKGLLKVNINNNKFSFFQHSYLHKNTIINNNINVFYFSEHDSILWIGTSKGISSLSFSASQFNSFMPLKEHGEIIDKIFGYFQASDKSKWIYTTNGLYYSKKAQNRYTKIRSNDYKFGFLNNKIIGNIIEDKDSILWFATDKGLFSHDLIKDITKKYIVKSESESEIKSNYITDIFKSGDSLWMATRAGILLFNKTKKTFKEYPIYPDSNSVKTDFHPQSVLYDSKGFVWLGVRFNGLYKYNLKTNKYKNYLYDINNESSISSNSVLSVFIDSDNNIWSATYTGGLNKYNSISDNFSHFNISNVLPSNTVYDILEDDNKNLWISTNRGIVKFNIKTNKTDIFSFKDGLYIYEFNNEVSFKAANGEMYFGGVGGMVSFYPQKILKNIQPPEIFLKDLYIHDKRVLPNSDILDGKALLEKETIKIKYQKATISFDVLLIEYLFPLRTQFAWKLNDYDIDWNYSKENQSRISYTNLPPGKYEISLKSSLGNGVWSKKPYSLKIEIIPPWWKSAIFRAVTFISILLSFFIFYTLRIYYLKKQKQHLNKLVAVQTEDLRALNENLEESNTEINAQNNELVQHRSHLENIVLERTQELKEALKKTEESNKFKSAILKNMSHEIRTPLNAIVGYSRLLLSNDIGNKGKSKYRDLITKSSNSLINVIENVIEISKLESNKIMLNDSYFDLNDIINDVLNDCIAKVETNVELSFNVDSTINIFCDKIKFKNILKQIVSNALNYTEKGYIKVSYSIESSDKIRLQQATIKQLKYNEYIHVKIEDTGVGIPIDQNEIIYEAFRKVEKHKDKLYRGVGLGLSISKHLLDIMQGAIWHESKVSEGTVFNFIVPVKKVSKT